MNRIVVVLVFLFANVAVAQKDYTVWVRDLHGNTVGEKVAAALERCTDPSIHYALVLDDALNNFPTGVMPKLCANCTLLDQRRGTSVRNAHFFVITPSITDLSARVNAAVQSCPPMGCTIEIPASNKPYTLSAPVIVSKNNVIIQCESQDPIVETYGNRVPRSPDGYYYWAINVTGDNFLMQGCTLDISSTTIGVGAILLYGSKHSKITNNAIFSSQPASKGSALGIRVEGNPNAIATDDEIYQNTITVPYIALSAGDFAQNNIVFHDNVTSKGYQPFDFNGASCGGHCPAPPDCFGIKYVHNTAHDHPSSGYIESASDVLIQGNTFINCGSGQFHLATIRVHQTKTKGPIRATILDNTFEGGPGTYAAIQVFQNAETYTISHNKIHHMGWDGILIDSTTGSPLHGVITNNEICDCGLGNPSEAACGIKFQSSTGNNVGDLEITGNEIFDDQGRPTQHSGICGNEAGTNIFGSLIRGNQATVKLPHGITTGAVEANEVPPQRSCQ